MRRDVKSSYKKRRTEISKLNNKMSMKMKV